MRALLEDWFSHYPEQHQEELRGRLRGTTANPCGAGTPGPLAPPRSPKGTRRNREFHSAFFELLLHEVMRRLGGMVEVHPTVPRRDPKRRRRDRHPDFLLCGPDDERTYVEAVVRADTGEDSERLKASVLDAIDEIDCPWFRLVVWDEEGEPTEAPSTKRIVSRVKSWLAGLESTRDALLAQLEQHGRNAMPELVIGEARGWRLVLRARPCREPAPPTERMIVSEMRGLREVRFGEELRKTLADKSKGYVDGEDAFVVAATAQDGRVHVTDYVAALLGTAQFTIQMRLDGSVAFEGETRRPDGTLGAGRARGVSAMLVAMHVRPWTLANSSLLLIRNPWARRPYDGVLARLSELVVDPDALQPRGWRPGRSIGDILGIPPDWPSSPLVLPA